MKPHHPPRHHTLIAPSFGQKKRRISAPKLARLDRRLVGKQLESGKSRTRERTPTDQDVVGPSRRGLIHLPVPSTIVGLEDYTREEVNDLPVPSPDTTIVGLEYYNPHWNG